MSGRRNPFERRSRRPHGDSHSWAVSYVDMLTLLLCFFIIFFSMDKKSIAKETSVFSDIVKVFGKGQKDAGGTENIGDGAKVDLGKKTQGVDLSKATETIQQIAASDFVRDHGIMNLAQKQLIVEIPLVSFFPSGEKTLTPEGIRVTAEMVKSLLPFKGKVHVTVQGHTDPRPIKKFSIEDNWELSVLRASTVLKEFIAAGFSSENVSAEGFADHRTPRDVASTDENFAYMRRITLKIRENAYE